MLLAPVLTSPASTNLEESVPVTVADFSTWPTPTTTRSKCWTWPPRLSRWWDSIRCLTKRFSDYYFLFPSAKSPNLSPCPVPHLHGRHRLGSFTTLRTNQSPHAAQISSQERNATGVGVGWTNARLFAHADASRGDKADRRGPQLLGSLSRG